MNLPMFGLSFYRKTHPTPTCDGRLKTWMSNCQVLQAALIFLHGSGDSGPGVQASGAASS